MYCAKCGKEMDDSAKFCPACGADAGVETAASPELPSYQAPSYGAASSSESDQSQSSGSGVGAMVCGIIGLVLCWVPIIGLILSIVALALGAKGRKTLPLDKRGMATAGFVMGIIGMVIGIIYIVALVVIAIIAGTMFSLAFGSLL